MRNLIYDGKAKSILSTNNNDEVIQLFKDTITIFNNPTPHVFEGKGAISCTISSIIFEFLEKNGIKTHLISTINKNEQLVKKVKIIPIEVTVRNYAFGNILKRSHFKNGEKLETPLIEFMYKNDELGDPLISESYVLNYLLDKNKDLFEEIKYTSFRINDLLKDFFEQKDIILGDFKIEFGLNKDNQLLLADEISGDTCRLMDKKNNFTPLDKDILRKNLGNVLNGYKEILNRIA
jgi:phosphoribosylaminoimidazole-succinocarboxamide synthase